MRPARARETIARRRRRPPPTLTPPLPLAPLPGNKTKQNPPPQKTPQKKQKKTQSASKRIKVTGSGKLMARHSGKQHLNEKMSREQKRQLGQQFVVDAGNVPQMTKCLPYHGVNGR